MRRARLSQGGSAAAVRACKLRESILAEVQRESAKTMSETFEIKQSAAIQRSSGEIEGLEEPLYVKTIVLRGELYRDMYDEHPGLAYFSTNHQRTFPVQNNCGLANAMELSVKLLKEAQDESAADEEYDGQFVAESIILLDQFDHAVQEFSQQYLGKGLYAKKSWRGQLPPESEWSAIEEKARVLISEASEESRWDNFDTARKLEARAAEMRRLVEIAKYASRVVA